MNWELAKRRLAAFLAALAGFAFVLWLAVMISKEFVKVMG